MDFFIGAYLVLSASFFFWLGKTVWTLQNTVKAQSSTIEAFHSLVEGMKTLLDSTDEPAMRERFKAYKEIVDLEKEGYKRKVDEETRNVLQKVKEGSSSSIKAIFRNSREFSYKMFGIIIGLMPYVPPEERSAQIEAMDWSGENKWIEESIRKIAAQAPYISAEDQEQTKRLAQLFSDLKLPPSPKED